MTTREYKLDFSTATPQGLRIDDFAMQRQLPHVLADVSLSPIHEDLLDVSRALNVADRFAPRHSDGNHTTERTLHLTVPVRRPEVWQQQEVTDTLLTALQFLTQDQWHIEFVPRSHPAKPSQNDKVLFQQSGPARDLSFGLYSGGADSTIGVALQGLKHPSVQQVVIAATGGHLAGQQNLSFEHISDQLERRGARRLVGVPYHTRVNRHAVREMLAVEDDKRLPEEFSQRNRGFLFLSLGAVIASSNGGNVLHVFENGPGAINLPYSRASLGADHTRSMHPRFISLMQQFLETVLGHPFSIQNPHWFETKGEMARHLKSEGLASLIPETVSCERFNTRGTGPRKEGKGIHCGVCTSCILRAISFKYARVADSSYTVNLDELQGDDRKWLTLMRDQAHVLQAATSGSGEPFVGLLKTFPDLRYAHDGLRLLGYSVEDVRTGLTRMYRQYADEWRSVTSPNAALPA